MCDIDTHAQLERITTKSDTDDDAGESTTVADVVTDLHQRWKEKRARWTALEQLENFTAPTVEQLEEFTAPDGAMHVQMGNSLAVASAPTLVPFTYRHPRRPSSRRRRRVPSDGLNDELQRPRRSSYRHRGRTMPHAMQRPSLG